MKFIIIILSSQAFTNNNSLHYERAQFFIRLNKTKNIRLFRSKNKYRSYTHVIICTNALQQITQNRNCDSYEHLIRQNKKIIGKRL